MVKRYCLKVSLVLFLLFIGLTQASYSQTVNLIGTPSAFQSCAGGVSFSQALTVNASVPSGSIAVIITAPAGFEVAAFLANGIYGPTTNISTPSSTLTQTVYIRLAAGASGSPSGNVVATCNSVSATKAVTGTVDPVPINGNTITGTQTLCIGSQGTAITGGAATDGVGGFTYLWESNVTGAYVTAPGISNGLDYVPGELLQTTTYRRKVTSGPCINISSTVTATVQNRIANNGVSSAQQSFCMSGSPAAIAANNAAATSYKWLMSEASADSGYVDAPGTNTAQNYTPPAATIKKSVWYKRVAIMSRVGLCGSDTSFSGKRGHAIRYGANNGNVSIEGGVPLALQGNTTKFAGMWIYNLNTNAANADQGLFTMGQTGTCQATLRFMLYKGSKLGVDEGCANATSGITVPYGKWVYVFVEYTPANKYAVGMLNDNGTITREVLTSMPSVVNQEAGSMHIGFNTIASQTFTGAIDEVSLWRVIPSNTAIVNMSNNGLTGSETGLEGYWDFDEGPGNATVADKSPYKRNGTINVINTTNWGGAGILTAAVIAPITSNSVSNAQTICANTLADSIRGSLPSGGNGIYTYQWQASTTNANSGYSNSLTTKDLQYLSAVTANTWFRRIVLSGGCRDTSSFAVRPGSAIALIGDSSSYVNITAGIPLALQGDSAKTVGMWVYPTNNNGALFTLGSTGSCQSTLRFELNNGKLHIDEGCAAATSNIAVPLNEWTYVFARYSTSSKFTVGKIEGGGVVSENLTALPAPVIQESGLMCIGGNTITNRYFTGKIDEVSIWDTTLSDEDIRFFSYRSTTFSGITPAGFWNLNAGSGTAIADNSGKGLAGTLANLTPAKAWVGGGLAITALPRIANNTISTAQVVCRGSVPAALTGLLPTNITSPRYQWLVSTTGATGGFAPIGVNDTSRNYTPVAPLAQDLWYRRVVYTQSICPNDTSAAIKLTVTDIITPGSNTVSAATNFCNVAAGSLLNASTPAGGDGTTYNYLWLVSATGPSSGFSAAPGTNNIKEYTVPGTVTQTGWYKRRVTSGGCAADTSAEIVKVYARILSNTAGASQAICYNATLTLTGSTATGGDGTLHTYQWMKSTISADSGFSTIGSNDTSKNYTESLTRQTWFKRVISSGICLNDTSAVIRVAVAPEITDQVLSAPAMMCAGDGNPVTLSGSQIDYDYVLRDNSNNAELATVPGTDSVIGFSKLVTTKGFTYNVLARRASLFDGAGFAADFNGSYYLESYNRINNTDNITFESWIYLRPGSTNRYIMYNGQPGSDGYGIFIDGGSKLCLLLGGVTFYSSNVVVPNNAWTHVGFVRRAGTWIIYMNGAPVYTFGNAGPNQARFDFTIGASNYVGSDKFNGYLDEMRFWTVARTDEEMLANYKRRLGAGGGLLRNYRFDNGSGTTVTDAIGGATMDVSYMGNIAWIRGLGTITCSKQLPGTVTIGVDSTKIANIISTAQAICPGGIPARLSTPVSTYGAYAWLSSTTSDSSGYSPATVPTTDSTYTPAALTQQTWVKRIATSALCGVDTSQSVKLAIATEAAAQTITPIDSPSCRNGSYIITLNGSEPDYDYLLRNNNTNTTIATLKGTGSALTFPVNNLTTTTTYNILGRSNFLYPGTGKGLAFDGVSGKKLALPNFTDKDNITIEMWVYDYGGTGSRILMYNGDPGLNGYGLRVESNRQLTVLMGNVIFYTTNVVLPQNRWTHLAVSKTTTAWEIYLNGVAQGISLALQPNTPSGGAALGALVNSDGVFNGIIDEFRFWTVTRTAAQIADSYNKYLPGTTPGLKYSYRFDDGPGSSIARNDGATANATLTSMNTTTSWVTGFGISSCLKEMPGTITLRIDTAVANNNISSLPQTICNGTIPATINASDPRGGDKLSYTYKWLSSTTGASSGFSAIAASNVKDYQPAALSTNTWYKRVVTSGVCAIPDTSAAIKITAQDTSKPVARAQHITAYLNAAGTVSISGAQVDNGSTDTCGIASYSVVPNSFGTTSIGANTVVFTVTDNNGNSASASATVTVLDTVRPLVAPKNITAYLNVAGYVTVAPSQVDNGSSDAAGIASISISPDSFTCANAGANTVTLTVTDNNGNSNTASATLTVADTIRPTAIAQNLAVYLNASGAAAITAAQVNNGSTDACGIATLSVSPSSFTCANIGANTVTLTVTDNNGNSKTATATVTVTDTVKPVATTQNITRYLNAAGTVSITAAQVNNGSTDACGIATLSVSPSSFTCANVGANTVTLTVTDNNGNIKTATATVTVMDTISPTATAQNITAYLNASGTVSVTGSQVNNGSTDACGIATLSVSPSSFTCANVGANTVTLTVTDNNGNIKTATATVTVTDTVKPVATAQNRTVYLNAAGTASITGAQINNGSTDACGIVTLSVSPSSFTCANVGANTVTLTVTDNNGNIKTATATVTVMDTISPVATTQNITTYLNAAGTVSITGSQINNGSTDACGIATLSVSPSSFTCANVGANTVTLTVTDNNGNIKTATATVTVTDTIKPVATAQNITTYLNAAGTASITGSQINNGSTDACGIATLSVSPSSFTCANVGANTVTLTVTDNNGNIKTATATVTVTDTVKPVATAQNITTYLNAAGTASITGSQINNGSTDACGIATLSVSPSSFTCANVGANTVTLTVTDNNGNIKTATATVTVTDTIKPVATAQNITTYLNAAGTASITASQVNNGSTDACGIATLSVSPSSFTCANVGANTVTLTVTDNNGNIKTATATVTVTDTVKPVATAQNRTVYLNAAGTASITGAQINNGSTDACGIATLSVSPSSFTCANVGANTVTLTVTDNNGNSKTATATVTVTDTIKPVATAQNITTYLNAAGTASITASQVNNGSTDACGIATLSVSPSSFACANVGANTVTLTVTDNNGNIKTATATVTVTDTIKPVATAQNITTYLNAAGTVSITGSQINNGSTDACGIATLSVSPSSFACANVGANTVTLTVTDNNGNIKTATATVTVTDTIKPVATAQNITTYLNAAGTVSITGSQINNGSTDACGIATLSVSPSSFTCANVGANTVTLTVTDNNGNIKTATATVTVTDTVKPVATAQNRTVYLNAAGTASITGAQINNGSTDACGIATLSVSPSSFTCANVGANTVTLTVTDNNGNIKTATATVTVTDTVKPVATAQNRTVYLNAAGTASVTGAQVNNGSTDACGIATLSVSPSSFTCANVGANTVTLTVTDNNGNIKTATATVTVTDTIKPVATAQNITTYLNPAGAASITAAQLNNGSTDACGIATLSVSPSSFTCANVGANTVTLTVTDNNGNIKTATATATVLDTIAPIIACKTDTIVLDATGHGSTTAAEVTQSATDNCFIKTATLSKTNFDSTNIGNNSVTLTVADSSGNSSTCVATVVVIESNPVAVCRNLTVYLNALGSATITPADADGGSASFIGITAREISRSTFDCTSIGNNMVMLRVYNAYNKSDSCQATVTVLDTIRPTVLGKNVTVYLDQSGAASINASGINNGSSDNCTFSLSAGRTMFDCSHTGTNTVMLHATDASGNKDSVSVTVTVLDTTRPVVRLKSNVVLYLNASGSATITPATINNGTSDNCGIDTLLLSKSSFTCADLGMQQVTLWAKDKKGNIDSATTHIVITDPIAPVARPKAKTIVYLSNNGQVVINPSLIDSASSDNCTITSRTLSQSVFNCQQTGNNTITFTVQDQSGNSSFATATVEVRDTVKPNVVVSNRTLYLTANGTASLTAAQVNNNSTDNCGIDSIWIGKVTFGCADIGSNTISLYVRDVNGNSNAASVLITVFDTVKPVMRPKQLLTLYLDASGIAALNTTMADSASSDNCALTALSLSKSTFECTSVGTNLVTLSGKDASGNTAGATLRVMVVDTIKPVLATTNATVYLNASGSGSVTAAQLTASAGDNCTAPTITLSKDHFNCTSRGSNTVTVTATDAIGNDVNATATVTVLDTMKPQVAAKDITVYLDASGGAAIVAGQANNSSADNCGIISYSLSKSSFTINDLGANTVVLSATDASANTGTASFTVTVLDTMKPVVVTKNLTAYLNASGAATITPVQVNNGSTDNATITTVSLSKTNFTCADLGANTITLSVTDASNNTASANASVLILDTIRPAIAAHDLTVYLDGLGQATITASQLGSSATDNCGAPALRASATTFGCNNMGANLVTLTATDVSGNSLSANATVTVLDTTGPNVVVNNNLNIYLDVAGLATLTAAQVNNGSTDNCSIASVSLGKTSFSAIHLGLNLIGFSATDGSGNVKTVNINVTVLDTTRPVAKGQPKTIYLNPAGMATIAANEIDNGSADNAGISFVALSKSNFTCADLGTNTVRLSVTDGSGNTAYADVAITVLDTIRPVLLTPPADLRFGLCGKKVNYVLPQIIDNCGTLKVEQINGIPAGGTYPEGVTTNTFKISDASGNSITVSFKVTIYPSYLPVTFANLEMCSNAAPVDLSQGKDSLVFTGSGVSSDLKTFDPSVSGAGNHVVSYTFTDSTGCEVNGFFFITVNAGPFKPVLVRTTSTTLTVRDKYDHYQWYKDNEQLAGETGQTLTVVRAGVYKVMVTTDRQCASVSDPIGIGVPTPVTGLNEAAESLLFNVYPNPSLGRFVIEKNATLRGNTTIIITDVLGKEVYRQVTADDVIDMDLTGIAAGAYYIRLQHEHGSTVKPIVIKN